MKDICTECPDFPKIPEICVKMIRRVNDEEGGIKKLVMEVFQAMWFSPVREKPTLDFNALMRKVISNPGLFFSFLTHFFFQIIFYRS